MNTFIAKPDITYAHTFNMAKHALSLVSHILVVLAALLGRTYGDCRILENTAGQVTTMAKQVGIKTMGSYRVTLLQDEKHRFLQLEKMPVLSLGFINSPTKISVTEATPGCSNEELLDHIEDVATNEKGETVVFFRKGPAGDKGHQGGNKKEVHYYGQNYQWLRKEVGQ